MEFNVEAAKADGLSDEEIQKLIAAGPPSIRNEEITTEETVVTPTPVQAPLKTKPTFNVEAAKAAGLSDEEIQKLIAAGPPKQPTISQEKYDKKYRNYCAMQAGDAKSDFAAKKMYETCLDQYGVSK